MSASWRWSANASLGGSLEATAAFRVGFAQVASGGSASLAYCDAAEVTPAEACASSNACAQTIGGLQARTGYSVRVTAVNEYVELRSSAFVVETPPPACASGEFANERHKCEGCPAATWSAGGSPAACTPCGCHRERGSGRGVSSSSSRNA